MTYSVVTVFGGAGFLGRSIVSALAREGAHLRVARRRPDEALRCKPMGDVGQVVPVAANIRDDGTLVVLASSSAWAARLRFESERLMAAARGSGKTVLSCSVRVGRN